MKLSVAFCASAALCVGLELGTAASVLAEDVNGEEVTEIVISPNRAPRDRSEVATSVSVVSGQEIEEKKQHTVQEALQNVAGVDLVRSGGLGGNLAIFLRGANPEHTLILVDGIEVNNPIVTARSANITNFTTDNIERIEVVRGPQSVLYGSDALGGVINIITKRGSGAPKVSVSSEAGSYNTFTESASALGGGEWYHYSLAGTRIDSGSISQAGAKYGNREHDGYGNTSFVSNVGLILPEKQEVNLFFRTHLAQSDLDATGGEGGDDLNHFFTQRQFFTRGETVLHLFAPELEQRLGISYSDQQFDDRDTPDDTHPFDSIDSAFRSDMLKYDLLNTLTVSDARLTLGLETENERGESDTEGTSAFGPFTSVFPGESARTNSVFLQGEYDYDGMFFSSTGIRVDHHDRFGSEVTWKVAPGIFIKDTGTRLSATAGTGFKAPSLFQLFSEFGNPDLDSEKSLGVDFGVEQTIVADHLKAGVTYFWNRFEDLITFEPSTLLYRNINDARTQGIEAFVDTALDSQLSCRFSYTLTDAEDRTNHTDLLRRPKNKVGAELRYQITDDLLARVSGSYISARDDTDFSSFPPERVRLGGYTLVDAALSYRIKRSVELYARIDNIFDRDYEQVLGFGEPGVAAYGGIKVNL